MVTLVSIQLAIQPLTYLGIEKKKRHVTGGTNWSIKLTIKTFKVSFKDKSPVAYNQSEI